MNNEQHINKSEATKDQNNTKSFGRDAGKLVSGTVIAQAVSLLLTPVITRIFSPDIYGVASVFTSIVSIIVVISCLRYEMSILLPKNPNDAGSILLLCIIVLTCMSIICIPIMILFGDLIVGLLGGNPEVKNYLFLVPIAVFIDGLYLALRYWNTRCKRFGTQATTQALQAISGNSLKFGFGAAGLVVPGTLILSGLFGNALGSIIISIHIIKYDLGVIKNGMSFKNIFKQAKIYKKFPLIDTWNHLINTVSWQLPVFMLGNFFSSVTVGLYALSFQILQLPMSLIGNSIGQVFYQRAAVAKQNNMLPTLVEDICAILILFSICPFLLLSIVGGDLFAIVFGDVWQGAGVIAQILSLWTLVWFVSSPLSLVVGILNIQEFGLKMSTLNLVTRFLSLFIGGLCGNLYLAIALFAVSGILTYGYCLYAWVTKSGGTFKSIWDKIWRVVIMWCGVVFVFAIFSWLPLPSYITCGVAILLGILYLVFIFKKNKLVRKYI